MKSNITEIFRGFFWGIGFSTTATLCVSAYFISVLPQIEETYKEVASNYTMQSLAEIAKDYEVDVLDIYKDDRSLKVTASVKNLTNNEALGRGINVNLFNKSGRFIGSCSSSRNHLFIEPNGIVYHEVSCRLFKIQIEQVAKAEATLKLI